MHKLYAIPLIIKTIADQNMQTFIRLPLFNYVPACSEVQVIVNPPNPYNTDLLSAHEHLLC